MKNSGSHPWSASSGRLLFVDDDPLFGRSVARLLRSNGVAVDITMSGTEALSLARRFHYSVVASDLNMPELDGLALIGRVRSFQPDAAYVIVTGETGFRSPLNPSGSPIVDEVVFKANVDQDLVRAVHRAITLHAQRIAHRYVDLVKDEVINRQIRVLVVEDDSTDLMRIERAVGRQVDGPFILTHVERLTSALALLRDETFDLVLTDLSLPDAHGLTAVAMVRAAAPDIPLLVVSGSRSKDVAEQCVRIGADDLLIKGEVDDVCLLRSMGNAIERRRARERLAHLANFNPVTGLPNRSMLTHRLAAVAERHDETRGNVAVLVVDLDGLGAVNDTYGAVTGDALLGEMGERLRRIARPTEFIAHLSADSFAVLIDRVETNSDVEEVAQRILHAVMRPVTVGNLQVMTTASVGGATTIDETTTGADLVDRAERARGVAKRLGRGRFHLHRTNHEDHAAARLSVEADLAGALARDEFVVFYQPKVDISAERVVGFEALVRWQHPTKGLVSPGVFIEPLEETGLINEVGDWVLRAALHQLADWQRRLDRPGLSMAVNVSERQTHEITLVERVRAALEAFDVDPTTLQLELTEGALIDGDRALEMLRALRAMGIGLAVDDFGTGYSALAYLERFPIDTIKIDRAFVSRCAETTSSHSITSAIIAMAKALGMGLVAEGVESADQVEVLRAQDCTVIQGYYFAKPMPAQGAEHWMLDYERVQRVA